VNTASCTRSWHNTARSLQSRLHLNSTTTTAAAAAAADHDDDDDSGGPDVSESFHSLSLPVWCPSLFLYQL